VRGLDHRRYSAVSVMEAVVGSHGELEKNLAKYYKKQLTRVDSPNNTEYFKFDFSFIN